MPDSHGTLLVFGSGPGIGRNVAGLFAERGFQKIILLSRNNVRLSEDADFVRAASADADVDAIEFDGADLESVRKGLQKIEASMGDVPLECVLFNQARTGPSKFFDFTVEELEADLKVCLPDNSCVVSHCNKLHRSASSAFTLLQSGQCRSY